MKLFVNSQERIFSGTTITELISSLDIKSTKGIALAINEKVISKSTWGKYQLKENDKILIIKATQGG